MFTELSPTSSRPSPAVPSSSRRVATVALETQSAIKFGLAVALGAVAVWAAMPTAAAALVLVAAAALAYRALIVLGHDPAKPRAIRPREEAGWDATLATVLAMTAVIIAASGAVIGAVAIGAGAVVLAALRLRTRYVAS